jgi:hypothetical protein
MPKYKVSAECTDYFRELEIEARDETEAEEKYQKLLDQGDVSVVASDFADLKVVKA